jgi:predicted enzyme related to lactoylglutathione lyase
MRTVTAVHVTRSNTILYCSKWAATVAFYRNVIGLHSSFENEWMVEFGLHDHTYLSLADANRTSIDPNNGVGVTLSWKVDDLDAASTQRATHEAAVAAPTRRMGASAVFMHDPEGNRIELWGAAT